MSGNFKSASRNNRRVNRNANRFVAINRKSFCALADIIFYRNERAIIHVFVNGAGNHQHSEFVCAGGNLNNSFSHIACKFCKFTAFTVRLRINRAVVATNQKIFKDTLPRQFNQIFIGVKIFLAAFKPIVKIFFWNLRFKFFNLSLLLTRNFIHFLLIEERGVLKNFRAVRGVIFRLRFISYSTWRAHNRSKSVNRQIRKFFVEGFKSLNTLHNFRRIEVLYTRAN